MAEVMLVDREKSERDAYARQMVQAGLDVIAVGTGKEAVDMLVARRPAVILIDLKLPKLDGLKTLEQIRERDTKTEVVMMIEGDPDGALARRVLRTGASSLITKPFAVERVRALLERVAPSRLRFRNRHGRQVDMPEVSASEAKNAFGKVLDTTLRQGAVLIKKHDAPTAVVMAWDEFQAREASRQTPLTVLTDRFDALYARMQTASVQKGLKRAFDATPEEMGKAAAAAARRHRD